MSKSSDASNMEPNETKTFLSNVHFDFQTFYVAKNSKEDYIVSMKLI